MQRLGAEVKAAVGHFNLHDCHSSSRSPFLLIPATWKVTWSHGWTFLEQFLQCTKTLAAFHSGLMCLLSLSIFPKVEEYWGYGKSKCHSFFMFCIPGDQNLMLHADKAPAFAGMYFSTALEHLNGHYSHCSGLNFKASYMWASFKLAALLH